MWRFQMDQRQSKRSVARWTGTLSLIVPLLCIGVCQGATESRSAGRSQEELVRLLSHKDAYLRAYAVYNMAYRFPESAARLVPFISDPHPLVRRAAILSLGLFRFEAATEQFTQALKDSNYGVRRAAVFALGNIKTPKALEALLAALQDTDAMVRQLALLAIARAGNREYVAKVIPLLKDDSPRVRRAAACALGMLGDPSALEPLRQLYRNRKCSEPWGKAALANKEAEKALKKNVNLDYKFLHFVETVDKLSEVAGVEIRVDDEILFTLNTSANNPDNLNSIRLAMWDVPFEKALGKVAQTVGAYYYVESGTINIATKSYEAYDTPVSLEVAAAMAFLGDRSVLSELRRFSNDRRFGTRARELLRAATQS